LYSIALNDVRDRDDTFSFRRLDADFRQYIPLLKEQWVLVFRGLAQITSADNGQVIPYYLLPSLGGAQTLRGYSDFRFQDKHLLLLGAEYRWLPSRIIDMAIFVDAGKVASERRDLDLDGLKTTYGIGIRFHGPTFTPLRLDIARGDEGIRAHITGGMTF
jgi:outer membrane protein assembly factor BamA